jgi:signal transduction histidine kinase
VRRFLPKSLIGQIALVMAGALLVAQGINFGVIFSERQRSTRTQIEGPAINRFVGFVQRLQPLPAPGRTALLAEYDRRGRFSIDSASLIAADQDEPRIAARVRALAQEYGVVLRDARGAISDTVAPPRLLPGERVPQPRERPEDRMRRLQTVLLSAQLADGSWVNARIVTPRPNPWLAARLAGSTLLIYFLVLGAMIWFAARLARPLRDLTSAAERFEGRGEAPRVEPRGPADLRHAILAFNAMSARVSTMLDEKDRMLGAIGHDLRTPLASLRIRAESVEPDEERQRMIATIEEMTIMLDDTLALARSGRASEPARSIDLTALADTVVEEFRALGHDVEMEECPRLTAAIQPNLLRRALRNLVENGIKYGGAVQVAVRPSGDRVAIEVTDRGPGIPEAEFGNVQEPFVRLEASRNRGTGGSGLGLALARSAAEAHGGSLELANRSEGGLRVRIVVPRVAVARP